MNKNEIKKNVTRTLYKTGFKLKKHSPEILVVGGVIGVVASGIMACKATTKLSTILDESRDHIDAINEVMENPKNVSAEYSEEDAKKDKVIVYTQTGVKVAKLHPLFSGPYLFLQFSEAATFFVREILLLRQLMQPLINHSKTTEAVWLRDLAKNWIKN